MSYALGNRLHELQQELVVILFLIREGCEIRYAEIEEGLGCWKAPNQIYTYAFTYSSFGDNFVVYGSDPMRIERVAQFYSAFKLSNPCVMTRPENQTQVGRTVVCGDYVLMVRGIVPVHPEKQTSYVCELLGTNGTGENYLTVKNLADLMACPDWFNPDSELLEDEEYI